VNEDASVSERSDSISDSIADSVADFGIRLVRVQVNIIVGRIAVCDICGKVERISDGL